MGWLKHGLVLAAVNGESTKGMVFSAAIEQIRNSGRPLTLRFELPTADAKQNKSESRTTAFDQSVEVVFMESGTMGMELTACARQDNRHSTCEVSAIQPGSLAASFAGLKTGMLVHTVAGHLVAKLSFRGVSNMVAEAARPLAMSFVPSPGTQPSITRRELARLYVLHNPVKLREMASLIGKYGEEPLLAMVQRKYQLKVALPPSCSEQISRNDVKVVIADPGPIGLKLAEHVQTGSAEIMDVMPGTQAATHASLRFGLALVTVAGVTVDDKSFPEVLQMLNGSDRPVTLCFVPTQRVSEGKSMPGMVSASTNTGGCNMATRVLQLQEQDEVAAATEVSPARRPGRSTEDVLRQHWQEEQLLAATDVAAPAQPENFHFYADAEEVGARKEVDAENADADVSGKDATETDEGVSESPTLRKLLCAAVEEQALDAARQQTMELSQVTDRTETAPAIEEVVSVVASTEGSAAEAMADAQAKANVESKVAIARLGSDTARSVATVSVVFSEEGALGLKFKPKKQFVQVVGVNKGTQAEQHAALNLEGMVLISLESGGKRIDVSTMPLTLVIQSINGAGRPLKMTFIRGAGAAAAAESNASAIVKAGEEDSDQLDLRKDFNLDTSGTLQGKDITEMQLNAESEAELVPVSGADVRGLDYTSFEVTFTEAGSLGLRLQKLVHSVPVGSDTLNLEAATGPVEVSKVNPGTQATRHASLTSGLLMLAVAGVSLDGKTYDEVMAMVKTCARPVTICFKRPTPAEQALWAAAAATAAPAAVQAKAVQATAVPATAVPATAVSAKQLAAQRALQEAGARQQAQEAAEATRQIEMEEALAADVASHSKQLAAASEKSASELLAAQAEIAKLHRRLAAEAAISKTKLEADGDKSAVSPEEGDTVRALAAVAQVAKDKKIAELTQQVEAETKRAQAAETRAQAAETRAAQVVVQSGARRKGGGCCGGRPN